MEVTDKGCRNLVYVEIIARVFEIGQPSIKGVAKKKLHCVSIAILHVPHTKPDTDVLRSHLKRFPEGVLPV